MADIKPPTIKGVIQVDDGPGWIKGGGHNSKTIFQPFMNAIKVIRAEYPDHYIGLTYGANAGQNSKFFTQYGFPNSASLRVAKEIDPVTTIDKVNILDMLNIMAGGAGQAAVLSSVDVSNMMIKTEMIASKFIIIPFDTMDSNVDKVGKGNLDAYGHKTDCLAFAEKFLALPKSIIIGWRNTKSLLPKLTNNTVRQDLVPGMDKLYFALGGGVASTVTTDSNLNPTTKDYIDFLIGKWDSESQKFIDSKIDLKKKVDDDDDDDDDDDSGKKLGDDKTKPTGVSAEQIKELRDKLEGVKLSDTDGEKKAAYGIAQEVFNAFFGGGDDKSKQTKPFLTEKVAELAKMAIFGKESSKASLDEIAKRLENPAAGTSSATSTVGPTIKPAIKPVKKYVFAFDIDDTLVKTGVLAGLSSGTLNGTDVSEHTSMLKLMKELTDAGHYVWIVTANNRITNDIFEKNYLKGDTDKKITTSKNYYFMNPATVDKDLKAQFDKTKISPYLTDSTTLDLTFEPTGDGSDFQSKSLKPYAMIAKWLELKNTNMDDVQMYLFDDNASYGTNCTNVKGGKIEFVQISSGPSPPHPPPPSGFKSDVLTKATEKFNAIPKTTKTTTTTPVTTDSDDPNSTTICSLDRFVDKLTDEADKFPCTHNFCKKYRQNKSGPKYNKKINVVSACFAILIYDGRGSDGKPDTEHGKIVLANEHVLEKGLPRDFHLFGGSIDGKSKCPLQTLYNEVAEEGRLLEIDKTLQDDADAKKEFDAIFRDAKGKFLTEPCVHKKTLYFIGIIKRDQTSIWDVDTTQKGEKRYKPGIKNTWNYDTDANDPINKLTTIFEQINSGKRPGDWEHTYGEKRVFGFFTDADIASPHTELYGQARKIFDVKVIQDKIRDVKKTIEFLPASPSP